MAHLSFVLVAALVASTIADPVSTKSQLSLILQKFSGKLFRETVLYKPKVNIAVAGPLVHVDLSSLLFGTSGASYDQLRTGLFISSADFAKTAYTEWYKDYTPPKDVHAHVGRKIYVKKINKALSTTFVENVRSFGLKVETIDFSDSSVVANIINSYVKDQIHYDMDLVEATDFNKDTELVWVNSAHFKAVLNDVYVAPTTFHLVDSTTVEKETIFFSGNYRYQNNKELGAKLIEIPLFEDAFLYIALPTKVNGLADLQKKVISSDAIVIAGRQMAISKVNVKIPKFHVEYRTDLKEILPKLAISTIFNDGLTGVYDDEVISVSNAYSGVAIEIEPGTTVAEQNFQGDEEFFIDQPFLWIISTKSVKMFTMGSYWGQ